MTTFLLMISILSPSPEPPCERASAVELARGVRVIAAERADRELDPHAACIAPFSIERAEPTDPADARDSASR